MLKAKRWPLSKVKAEVEAIRDACDQPIDKRIRPLVIGLRRFGIRTTISCQGHANGFRYPWVDCDRRDTLLLLELIQRQNRPVKIGSVANNNRWVIMPYTMDEVRLIPMDTTKSLRTLKKYAEEFGEFLQQL